MLNGSMPNQKSEASRIALIVALGTGAFVLGIAITLGVVMIKSQGDKIALMTEKVELLKSQQALQNEQAVTRAAGADLLALQAAQSQRAPVVATPTPQPAPVVAAAAVAPVAPAAASTHANANPTAQKIRSLVNVAVQQDNTTGLSGDTGLDSATIKNAQRLETLAIIHAGVQELVQAVVEGKYDIHTNYEDDDFSGRIHFEFVGQENDQTALERFLADAAEKGVVKHSNAVVGSDGKVNGHILLFDLVERALENGTLEEQRAGQKMRAQALAMLAKDVDVGEPANAQGEKFYTVEPGDSLAYIALQFYGNTNAFTRIYEANRAQLTTPDQIRVGQRLRIPSA